MTIEDEEVDVMADEIDEDIFFTHRAKVYRFMSSVYEWKRKLNFDAVKSLKSGKHLRNNRTRIHRYRTRCDEEADWFSDYFSATIKTISAFQLTCFLFR